MTDQNESPNTPPKPNVVALGSAGGVLLVIVIAFAMTGRGGTEDAETVAKLIEPVARVEVAPAVAAPAAPPAPAAAEAAAAPAAEAAPATPEPAPAAAQESTAAAEPAAEPAAAAAQPAPAEEAPAAAAPAAQEAPAAAPPAPAPVAAAAPAPAAPVADAGSADGKAVYSKICVMCHSTGVSGAPKLGDKAAWAPRIATGVDTLVKNAISGKKLMPAKGGSPTLSEEQVRAAVEYMVGQAK